MVDSVQFRVLSILRTINSHVVSQTLTGGLVLSFFGDVTVDLTEAAFTKVPAKIHVILVFGSVTLILPPDQVSDSHIIQISGGVRDRRSSRPRLHIGDKPHIRLSGVVVLGNVDITS